MLNWSGKRLACFLGFLAALPLLVAALTAWFWRPESKLWIYGTGLTSALLVSAAGAWHLRRNLKRQADFLIAHGRGMAQAEPNIMAWKPQALSRLGPLGPAISAMCDALVEYLSLYRRFFESSPDMFLYISPKTGRVLDANLAFCQALGRLRSEVVDQPVEGMVALEHSWNIILAGEEGVFRGQISAGQGIIKVEAKLFWERGTEGEPWILAASMSDVTQKEALHRELLHKSAALEKAFMNIKDVEELKDQFLTTLSHELKTPLVALKGFLQLIMQGRAAPDETAGYLEICWRNLRKLETQIENLLDLARLSHAKDHYEMGPVDLASVLKTETENLRPLAAERQVTLDIEIFSLKNTMVLGNQEKLVQLVDNLLLNAIKYNKEGGEVRISLKSRDHIMVLEVQDSGVGMDREQMANIFNRFYRADLLGTGRIEGLGIGLSLVQEIVHLHNGEIKVESQPGVGTTFTVELEVYA